MDCFKLNFQVIFKIQAFSFKILLRFRHFIPGYSLGSGISSKSFQDQAISSKIFQDSEIFGKILQDETLSSEIFQDTCKNNALPSKILKAKSDILAKNDGSSTGEDLFSI